MKCIFISLFRNLQLRLKKIPKPFERSISFFFFFLGCFEVKCHYPWVSVVPIPSEDRLTPLTQKRVVPKSDMTTSSYQTRSPGLTNETNWVIVSFVTPTSRKTTFITFPLILTSSTQLIMGVLITGVRDKRRWGRGRNDSYYSKSTGHPTSDFETSTDSLSLNRIPGDRIISWIF